MIVDHIENWKAYPLGEAWELAFDFLEGLSGDSEERRYDLDGDSVFGIVMSYPTRRETDEDTVLEAHRKYVDVQMALAGNERIACYPTQTLAEETAYDPDRDVQFFQFQGESPIQLGMHPGTFVCLLPQDAHMPQLFTESPGSIVKKVVVKIALDRLNLTG